ncbi:CRISPR-associated protein Csn2-St [Enterococcus pingfangensis]
MQISLEYEHQEFIDLELHDVNYFLGPNHTLKWKLYRGIKRFSTGKNLSDLEEHVYGDDGIVIYCDEKKMKAKELPIYYLDCRESFLKQYQQGKGNLMDNEIQSIGDLFEINKGIEKINNELLKFEVQFSEAFKEKFTYVQPSLRELNYTDLTKYFLLLSFFEDGETYPVEMMDIEKLIDDYCQLLIGELSRTQKMTWLWISNPNAFMSKKFFRMFLQKLKKIANDSGILKIFVLSEDHLDLDYQESDIEATVLLYNEYQQLPEFSLLNETIKRHYPDELSQMNETMIPQLFRVFPYIGKSKNKDETIYLRDKDVVLLMVVDELLGYDHFPEFQDDYQSMTSLEEKFLIDTK